MTINTGEGDTKERFSPFFQAGRKKEENGKRGERVWGRYLRMIIASPEGAVSYVWPPGPAGVYAPPPAQHTHRNTHTAQVVLLLWGPQSVYTLKGQKASPHNANCSTLTGPCQVGTEIQIHTEMSRQWSGGGDPKLRKGTNQGSTIHREHIQKPSK